MHLSLDRILLLLWLTFGSVNALGLSCIKVASALIGRPTHLYNLFQTEICERGCEPTVPHWDLWTRNNSFVPAVRNIMTRMNIPHSENALFKMGDDVAAIIKVQCGPMLGDRHICSDPATLADFGNCFKRYFFKASLKYIPILLPMASDAACKEQYQYLQGNELWDETIPKNMRAYASVCHDLEAESVERQQEPSGEEGSVEFENHEDL
ncbi:hypothetical protein N7539_009227 [Penicillium diatomitis]|uniref:Uncharacterized protein n=1 Tax=Penicillium diatomitis TaxID=2819901 RepID=A0A9W9WLA5_9EURO|nr:uncharacterized protein N7539_009227 [Penicillium diatomitis]KAJ5469609.1 hypothetical protein N7539_009227 [Penicillium diatomitis]